VLEPPVEPALAVRMDRPLLTSAVANLVQNAVKFTREGPQPAGEGVRLPHRAPVGRLNRTTGR
jgi:signal transduction histidine kinase